MGHRDGMKFEEALKAIETVDRLIVEYVELKEVLRKMYEAGYLDGFRKGQTYDPKWDAD